MREKIFVLFGVALAAALAELLLAGEKKDGVRRAFHILVSLAVLFCLVQPFFTFLQKGNDVLSLPQEDAGESAYEQIYTDTVGRAVVRDLEDGVCDLLEREYGIAREDCLVCVSTGEGGNLTKISVYLSGKALLSDPLPIEEDLTLRFGCETEVR